MSFVGFKKVSSADELKELLNIYSQQSQQQSYYFLRWLDRVSGIITNLPEDFSNSEGQFFNAELELRWKPEGKGYSILLLRANNHHQDSELGFKEIGGEWEVSEEQNAYFYGVDEKKLPTRFPKGFIYKNQQQENIKPKDIPLAQRNFFNKHTATVHFVALTLKN
ncbi:hypothetical protein Riv7116_3420 [Rivularia sp. PCC 7116]|uniref:hypothetical protein n=1 Tax=Rivularia sp. PCC 7116 TaxID=373994 RepID=UPI00029ECD6E|nr:hypothetical protein [Rivularia sp. PCC 7116]AFY55876.1 hypothetical protein Riv7116_3420 [Rivularia sp. PCC 7116]